MYLQTFITFLFRLLKIAIIIFLFLVSNVHGGIDQIPKRKDQYNVTFAANNFFISNFPLTGGLYYYHCKITWNDPTSFPLFIVKVAGHHLAWDVYSIAVGKKQNSTQLYVVFGGTVKVFDGVSLPGQNNSGMFIAKFVFNCRPDGGTRQVSFVQPPNAPHDSYIHPDYYVIGVEPYGKFAFGFSNAFILVYDLNYFKLKSWLANLTWPNSTFLPLAVDVTDNFAAVAGFTQEINSFTPTVYLITYNSSALNETFFNSASLNLSSDSQLNSNEFANFVVVANWSSDHSLVNPLMKISVSINDNDGHILAGIPSDNIVHLFVANLSSDQKTLVYVSSRKYSAGGGSAYGYGAGVTWLNEGKNAAVLANAYSGSTLLRSQIHFYDMSMKTIKDETLPLSVFPNNQQPVTRPSSDEKVTPLFGPLIVAIASSTPENSSSSLNAIDANGRMLIILPLKPGFCSSKYNEFIANHGAPPFYRTVMVSYFLPNTLQCPPGMYKNESGPWSCSLCESGTMNPGIHINTNVNCIKCSNESFCGPGSVRESKLLEDVNQTQNYPQSSEELVFDDILMQTTFSIDCVAKSPLFWSLIVTAFILIIILVMKLLKFSLRFKGFRLF